MIPYLILNLLIIYMRRKKYINIVISGILIIFLGLRFNVGSDFYNYYKVAKVFEELEKSSIFSTLEDYSGGEAYLYYKIEILNKILYRITWYFKKEQLIFFLYAILQIGFICRGLERRKIKSIYPWLFFITFPLFLFSYMSIMRQAVAMSIIFYNYNNYRENNLKKFIFYQLIAFLFHYSSIFSIFFIFLIGKRIDRKNIALIIIIIFIIFNIFNILNIKYNIIYSNYSKNIITSGGTKVGFLFIGIGIFVFFIYKKLILINEENKKILNIILFSCGIYLGIYFYGDIFSRIAMYYFIYILYLIDEFFKIFKNKTMIKSMFIMISISIFFIYYYNVNLLENNIKYQIYLQKVD